MTYSGGMGDRLLVKQVAFKSDSKNPRQKAACVMNDRPVGTDNEYALTPEEAAFRSRHRLYWSNYVCLKRAQREKTALDCSNATLIDMNDCKNLLTAKLPKIKEQSIAKKMLSQVVAPRLVIKATEEILVPLSPLQIYNVKIAPTILSYGLVSGFFMHMSDPLIQSVLSNHYIILDDLGRTQKYESSYPMDGKFERFPSNVASSLFCVESDLFSKRTFGDYTTWRTDYQSS